MNACRRIADTVRPLLGGVFSDLESRARSYDGPLYPLHYGDTWLSPPTEVFEELPGDGLYKYASPCGDERFLCAAIEAMASKVGVRRQPEEVVAVSGATAGIRDAVQALVAPGDEVILPSPFWPLIRGTVWARGARPVEVPFFTRLDDADFDPEGALEAAVTSRCRLIYLNTPHNPTGRVLPGEVLSGVAKVAARHDLWVLADEVYDEVYFSEAPPPRTWSRPDLIERTVAVHSMSKAYAMAGARVGWAHGPKEAMEAIRAVHTYQDFGPAKPEQLRAARVLGAGDAWMRRTRALYADAGRIASEALGIPAIQGGTFAFAPAPGDCDEFLKRSADKGVLLTPGRVCGEDYTDWFRLSFTVVPPPELEKALQIIDLFLRRRSCRCNLRDVR
jgi:N-succinyldiaminopimelate aminotransferase